VLRPSIEVLEQRHDGRRERLGKVAYRDTSTLSPAETVDEILGRAVEAMVG